MSDFKYLKLAIYSFLLTVIVSACATEYNLATRQEESFFVSDQKEEAIGDKVSQQFQKHFKINRDIDVNERVQRILDEIVAVCDRKAIIYSIHVIDDDKINAVSLPGGPIYIFQGLIDKVDNDDQLAGVIAHEVGHITARHGIKRLQSSYGYIALQALAVSSGDGSALAGVKTAYTSLFLAHSQKDEFQSDKLAVKYMKAAGYDPKEMIKFLEKLVEQNRKAPIRPKYYGRTHPFANQRISVVNQTIKGSPDFEDYLNLTENEF